MKNLIMLVDDDPLFRAMGAELLDRDGWQVEVLDCAEAVINAMAFKRPKLLITDIHMPGMNGLELTKYFMDHIPEVPVVIFTGQGNEDTAVECFRIGAVDYIRKENIASELAKCVERILAEKFGEDVSDAREREFEELSHEEPKIPDRGLQSEYIVRRWGNSVNSLSTERAEERELTEIKLRILRRQVERLDKWIALDRSYIPHQKNVRHAFSDVVYMMPLYSDGRAAVDKRFAVFCRDVSTKGCLVIRNGMLYGKEWAIYFPHLAGISPQSACVQARVIGGSPIPLGMYEIGLSFHGVIQLRAEDEAVMRPRKCS